MINNFSILTKQVFLFENNIPDYQAIIEMIGDSQFVLIGESTHGTHEFYEIRAQISKKLIEEKGFNAIAIEGDWPDTYNINRYVKGNSNLKSAIESLEGFKRFPTWMWRNKVILGFIEWLHIYNQNCLDTDKVGFYGLDLYSLNASIEAVIKYLQQNDVEAAEKAKQRYACFDRFKDDPQTYGYANLFGMTQSCEDAVVEQLIELNNYSYKYLIDNGVKDNEFFYVEQNARLIKNAEKYYRSMFNRRISSWNIRDSHMAETLQILAQHLTSIKKEPAKIIVWAHNSHIGNARATEAGQHGEINIGQLVKEKYNDKAFLIGFLTYSGTVTAASAWDGIVERKHVRPALINSYEQLFHQFNIPNFIINFKHNSNIKQIIPNNLLERAIGVIYVPQTERASHYFYTNLAKQFDGLIYLDKTHAIEPLEYTAIWHEGEVFETFPSGL